MKKKNKACSLLVAIGVLLLEIIQLFNALIFFFMLYQNKHAVFQIIKKLFLWTSQT